MATDAGPATSSQFDSVSVSTTSAFSINSPHWGLIKYGQTVNTLHGLPWNRLPSVQLGWELATSFGKRIPKESEGCHFLGEVMSHGSVSAPPWTPAPPGESQMQMEKGHLTRLSNELSY